MDSPELSTSGMFEYLFEVFFLPVAPGFQSLKGLNLVRCRTHNMVRLSDYILPLEERHTFILIARYKAYPSLGLGVYEGQPKYTKVFDPAVSTRLPRQ